MRDFAAVIDRRYMLQIFFILGVFLRFFGLDLFVKQGVAGKSLP
jgi:hypothetical protein